MKFTQLVIWLLYAPGILYAQRNGEVPNVGRVQLNEGQNKVVFYVEEYNKSPKRDKFYHWYSSQQVKITEGGYSGKVLHGDYTKYFANKNIAEKGTFKKGLKHSLWRSWYVDGKLQKESTWKGGEENGQFRFWDEEGKLVEQGRLYQGKRHGKLKVWEKDSGMFVSQYFERGCEISKEEYVQRNLISRTGNYISRQWQKMFSKQKKELD